MTGNADTSSSETGNEGDKPVILLVDDAPVNINLLVETLRGSYRLRVAVDGDLALRSIREHGYPGLILLDVMMPNVDGYEVLQRLRNEDPGFNTPVIFLTAKCGPEDETRGLELGAVDYIFKPFNPMAIRAKVKTHLELANHRNVIESMLKDQLKFISKNSVEQRNASALHEQTLQQHLEAIKRNEERLRLALWASGNELWDWDIVNGRILRSNQEVFHALPNTLYENTIDEQAQFIHPDDFPTYKANLEAHLCGASDFFQVQYRARVGCGDRYVWLEDTGKIVEYEEGRPSRMVGTLANIVDRKHTEAQLDLVAKTFENTSDGVWICDKSGHIVTINPAFTTITGYSESDVIGASIQQMANLKTNLTSTTTETIMEQGSWSGEILARKKNDQEFSQHLRVHPILDKAGIVSHYVGIFTDITDKSRAEKELRRLTNYDALTALPNRTLFIERLNQRIAASDSEDNGAATILIDLDNFKQKNDTLGQETADRLLVAIAQRLNNCKSDGDTVARLGGDEFAVIIDRFDNIHAVAKQAELILSRLKVPFNIDGIDVPVSASLGISMFPNDGRTTEELMRNADTAMFETKKRGKANFQFFTSGMNEDVVSRLRLEDELRHALSTDEFEIYYQPQINLNTGNIENVEALIRWNSPTRGMISPNDFIPIAEESDLILKIGKLVLRKACEQRKLWQDMGLMSGRISVNLSARQFMQTDILSQVDSILADTELSGELLELEITEGTVMKNTEKAISVMQSLRDRQISLAIDDFGTGYSSLAYLKRFPVNILKVDRCFVVDMLSSKQDLSIVESIISLGHSLGLSVVVEGVETYEQAQVVKKLNAELIQGFLFSKPVPAKDFENLLRTHANLYASAMDSGTISARRLN